jgi:UDP-2,3-diacylglucosamine pyrophosphatase LpxH
MKKRKVEIAVISDIHLGTYGCHAEELLAYLKSIQPEILVLNGDIFDIWQMKKSYFPSAHLEVARKILKFSNEGTKVYYITGNHDDALRALGSCHFGNIELCNHLVLRLHNKTFWFFHGDVFDLSMKHARWLAKLGGRGYDTLIRINRVINQMRNTFGAGPTSFASRVKVSVKKAVKAVQDFEQMAIDHAIDRKYDYVICGHIHVPQIAEIKTEHGSTTYLNSGDWVEHLTALEYNNKQWKLFKYDPFDFEFSNPKLTVPIKSKKYPKHPVLEHWFADLDTVQY